MAFRWFVLMAVTIFLPIHVNGVEKLSEKDRSDIAELVDSLNQGLPKMVNEFTRWDSTKVTGPYVSYLFTLVNLTKEEAAENIGFILYRQALEEFCTADGYLSKLRNYGVDLSLYYRDTNEEIVSSLMLSNEDCPGENGADDTIGAEPESDDSIIIKPEWLSWSEQLFGTSETLGRQQAGLYERLQGKWENDEEPVLYQFLANGFVHRIEGNRLKKLRYTISDRNKEQRLILVKINRNSPDSYDMYIQFSANQPEARIAVVKDGSKTFENWTWTGRPDMLAIANQYSQGRKPWISWSQVTASKEYQELDPDNMAQVRTNWETMFGNN